LAAGKARELALTSVEPGAQPSDEWMTFEEENGYVIARAVIEARMNIAVDRETYIGYLRQTEFE
jgi:hypothetical protein